MITITTHVARSPIDVFTYVTDLGLMPTWRSDVRSAVTEDGYPMRRGSVICVNDDVLLEVTAYEPGRLFELGQVRIELEPSGSGTAMRVTIPDRRKLRRQWHTNCRRVQAILG
jgi:uncharacterized protein YndB with AHSA1/START domain